MAKRTSKVHKPGGPPIPPDQVTALQVEGPRTADNRDRGGRPANTFPAVEAVSVGGVTVARHTLSVQAEQLASITGRVLQRLNHQLKATRNMPGPEWFEAYRYVQAATLGLLKEQRERAKLTVGEREKASTENLAAQLRAEFLRAAHTFTPEEWAMLDRVRAEQASTGTRT